MNSAAPLRLALVTNIPAPYRVPVLNRLAAMTGVTLRVFYAARREPDREWDLPPIEHDAVFLPGRVFERNGRFIHHNPAVWGALSDFAPDVVVSTGFNPTHLLAWLHATLHRRAHVVMTDGTDRSEAMLGRRHRWVRRVVFGTSRSFIVASDGGERLLAGYGVPDSRIHRSPLCANMSVDWSAAGGGKRDIDLLFSGRLVATKNAAFALRVARGTAERLGRPLVMVVLGSGPEHEALREQAAQIAPQVQVLLPGHAAQAELPRWFGRARAFLFPTRFDPWGIVANEACLAGVPVLVSPLAGVAGELVRDGVSGFVLPLDEARWIDAAASLLGDAALHARLSQGARDAVAPYNADAAALGIVQAARQALAG